MSNIRQYLENAVRVYGEPLEAVVIGVHDNRRWDDDSPLPDEGVVLSPEIALVKLDVEYDSGFGGADCYPIYAWTASRVFFIAEYDGATSLAWAPRHPVAIMPSFSGERED